MKKHLASSLLLLLICTLIASGATERVNMIMFANDAQSPQQEEEEEVSLRFQLTVDGASLPNENLTFSVSPDNGTAYLALFTSSTDADGYAMFILRFRENASGTYTVSVGLSSYPISFRFNIIYSETPTVVSSSTTTVPPPSTLVKISADNQVAAPGDSLTFVVELQDSDGNPLSGVDLNFIFYGDGDTASLNPGTGTTDANGRAEVTLTLGTNAEGEYTVEAYRSDDFGVYVNFTVTVDRSPPRATRLEKISGDNQTGFTGTALENPFVIEVRDQFDDPISGVTVTFAVTGGGGSLSRTTGTTDGGGQVESTLTLGGEPGANTVEVSVEGISQTAVFSAEAALQPPTPTALQTVSDDNQEDQIVQTAMDPFIVEVHDQNGNPLEDVPVTFTIVGDDGSMSTITTTTDENGRAEITLPPGTDPGTYTVTGRVEGIAETVTFTVVVPREFDLSLSVGFHFIHLPLRVSVVDGMAMSIESVSELYDALGGADTVSFLITHDPATQAWRSYFGDADKGTIADVGLTDQAGILVSVKAPVSVRLGGTALGMDGTAAITLTPGLNLVGLPLRDPNLRRVSDLFALEGSADNVHIIVVTADGVFKAVGRAGDVGDIPIIGGQAFLLVAAEGATVSIVGSAWGE